MGGGGGTGGREAGRTGGGRGTGDKKEKGREEGSLRWREAGEKFKRAVKETNPTTFLDFHLTFSKILYTRKVKKRKFVLGIKKKRHYFL